MIRITVIEGRGEPRNYHLNTNCVRLGRDPQNDIVLRDSYISSRHAEIRLGPQGPFFRDFVSTNGSVLLRGAQRMAVGEKVGYRTSLEEGDELHLGDAASPVVVRVVLVGEKRQEVAPVAVPRADALDATHADAVVSMPDRFDREALLALHRLTSRLSAQLQADDLLRAFAECTLEAFRKATHVSVYLVSDEDGEFTPGIALGRSGETVALAVSRTVRDDVLAKGRAVLFHEADVGFDKSDSLHESSIRGGIAAPLWNGSRVLGLVQVDCRGATNEIFERRDLEVLVVFAHQAAMGLANANLHADLQRQCEDSIRGLVRTLEAKDRYTSGHSEAVGSLCLELACFMGLPPTQCEQIERAALLHDIGKIGIPWDVLNKTGPLTPEEFRVLKTHPELGARILEPFTFLSDLLPIVLHHHERHDGRGYPAGLAGANVPVGARILSVVDTFHALTSDRAYRAGVGTAVALAELRRAAGTQFDPAVVEALCQLLEPAEPALEEQDESATVLLGG